MTARLVARLELQHHETAALDAACLVLVPGGLPDGDRDIDAARCRVVDAVATLAPYAADRGVRVAVDTFHVWWEPGVLDQIARAADRIFSYQTCDWITPFPSDSLLSRGTRWAPAEALWHLTDPIAVLSGWPANPNQ